MAVTLSQKSYDALLDDLERLRKCNIDLEEKLNKEIKLSYEIEGNLYDVSKQRDVLINDMAEIKRKAEAFDEIVNALEESANSYELVARIKLEVLNYQKLEEQND
ncbi:hypothetical protein [Staphylococcus capitis]|uniref:hypothetical protein n=1 Tax=Staphylococcus capitis TaxID=29388 RepID=UPI000E681D23|nr:hypothetical protein [Staphylococcus capitis]RIM52314.1 hypothetical protein BU610_07220 [Staphylococcus capitis]